MPHDDIRRNRLVLMAFSAISLLLILIMLGCLVALAFTGSMWWLLATVLMIGALIEWGSGSVSTRVFDWLEHRDADR